MIDRQYFRSVYFREPGGVLFEVATDAPGFTIDESPAELGTSLKLPPMYETMRERIERDAAADPAAAVAAPRRSGCRTVATAGIQAPFRLRHRSGPAASAAAARHRRQRRRPPAPGRRAPARGGAAEPARPGSGERHAPVLPPARGGCVRPGRPAPRTHELADFVDAARTYDSPTAPSRWVSRTGPTSRRRCSCSGRARSAGPSCSGRWCRWCPSRCPRSGGCRCRSSPGAADPIVQPEQSEALADLLRRAGARSTSTGSPAVMA